MPETTAGYASRTTNAVSMNSALNKGTCKSNPTLLHDWDFRGCTTNVPVPDRVCAAVPRRCAGISKATPMNGPTCSDGDGYYDDGISRDGIFLDGVDDYVDIDNFKFGGPMSVEVYVKYDTNSLNDNSSVFFLAMECSATMSSCRTQCC
ncbi:hypothetical protein TrLO_g4196 [Triparma laevis f. longispina]|uniref:Uncharacterized protein n=1 Tax=Triparma laevis f. longispina TaxID=1714387 RepID=A0A9W7KW46_9STRA|nr:hypothetical protein TrLO_g4196 [Triparma laevis f. longispina]